MLMLANGASGCNESQETLSKMIQSHNIEFILNASTNECDENDSFEEELIDHDHAFWFDEIFKRIKETGMVIIEPYYQPKLNKVFKDLFNRLPLWSAVMKPYFSSSHDLATSSETEARFHVLKSVVFKNHTLPLRPDTFAKVLFPYLDSVAKLASIAYPHQVSKKNSISTEYVAICSNF